jgi:hypothetical protein
VRSRNADLEWVSGILAAPPLKVTVGRRRLPAAPHGTFAILPTAGRPRFVVPLAPRRAAAAALGDSSYTPGLRVRLARAVGRIGITLGIAGHLFRDRLSISDIDGEREQPLADVLLSERLADIFGRHDLMVAMHVGPARPNRKPLVRVLGADGAFVGYVKIGWNPLTRQLVRNEARALTDLDRRRSSFNALEAPRLVYEGTWREFEILALTPLRGRAFRTTRSHLDVAAAAMKEISDWAPRAERPLADSEYWRRTKARIGDMTEDGRLMHLAEVVAERFGDEVLAFGAWHGDWAPWNMAWRDGRLAVWDWERSTNDAPVGLDAAHFDFQLALSTSRNRSLPALTKVVAGEVQMLSALALPRDRERLLLVLHLLEMGLRWEEGRRAGMSPVDSLYVPALAVLLGERSDLV